MRKLKRKENRKDYFANKLRQKIHMTEIPNKSYDKPKKELDPFKEGFIVQFDYILNIVKEFPQVQLVFGIYRRGVQIDEPKLVDVVFTEDSHDPSFSIAYFDKKNVLRKLKAHADTMLIIELQVPERKDSYAENTIHTADKNSGEINNMKTYAWTWIDLFTVKRGIKEGAFKVPFYRPPTNLSVSKENIGKYIRITPTMLYLRVMKLEPSNISEILWNPSYKDSYVIHDFHDFIPRKLFDDENNEKQNKGLNIHIHYVKGIIPNTHVRVAWWLQVGQDILSQDNGSLWFFATKGLKGNNSTVREIPQAVTVGNLNPVENEKSNEEKVDDKQGYAKTAATSNGLLEFNEVKTWIRDIEASYKDVKGNIIWNAYLIIQLLEKKINAYPKKVTNRTMLEEDYELKGYTVLQLNTKEGSLVYGTFHLEFFEGPIFIEELDPEKRLGTVVKITLYPVEYKLPYDEVHHDKDQNYKLIKEDYDSYVVERE